MPGLTPPSQPNLPIDLLPSVASAVGPISSNIKPEGKVKSGVRSDNMDIIWQIIQAFMPRPGIPGLSNMGVGVPGMGMPGIGMGFGGLPLGINGGAVNAGMQALGQLFSGLKR